MIRAEHLVKRYGATLAVDDVSFAVERNQIVGFLGPNGAGKSTVLKMLSTWLPPTSGRATVAGCDVQRDPMGVRSALGYLPEHNALYDGMRVLDFLRFMARARGLSGALLRTRLEWVIDACNLVPVRAKRVQECSKGFRQRIGLAASLVHDPEVILLDEPTHGLDPLQVVAFRDFLRSLAKDRAILFSSHILSEVAAICERVLIIQGGRLLTDTRVETLEARAKADGQDLERVVLDIVRKGAESGAPARAEATR